MTPQELTTGNWVNYKGEPIQVTLLGEYGIQSKTEDQTINAKFFTPDITPIEVTPEILEKTGFEKSGDGQHYFIGHFGFCLIFDGSDWCMKPRINDDMVIAYCKHLHQLQNLFYCLTAKELQIKL